jgi:methyl-accepting chemotaxis protein
MARATSLAAAQSVERKLIALLALIAAIAVVGVLAIVPYRLYARDVRLAEVTAHRIGSLLHVALANQLQKSTNTEDIADLVNRFQGIADMKVQLRQLLPGETSPGDPSGAGTSTRNDTDLTYTAPPILDKDGHTWVASMHFDLSPMKRESVRLIIDLMLAVLVGSALFSVAVFVLVRNAVLQPLREVTRQVERFAEGERLERLPQYESAEVSSLLDALDRARQAKLGA